MVTFKLILLYIFENYSCYNTDWIAINKEIGFDPKNTVIKRLTGFRFK